MAKGDNLTQVASALTPTDIQYLNDQHPGMGERINQTLVHLGNVLGAAAGHRGTVVLAKQKKTDAKGKLEATLSASEGRIEQAADPVDDMDVVNLRTLRRYMLKEEDTRIEETGETKKAKPPCKPIGLQEPHQISTGLETLYAVQVLNELVYVLGFAAFLGHLQIYRREQNNDLVLVSDLILTEAMQKMVLQGRFLYLTRTDSGSGNLIIVDVARPKFPIEVVAFAVGLTPKNVANQGRWIYVPGNGGVKIVDVSEPIEPVVRGTAS